MKSFTSLYSVWWCVCFLSHNEELLMNCTAVSSPLTVRIKISYTCFTFTWVMKTTNTLLLNYSSRWLLWTLHKQVSDFSNYFVHVYSTWVFITKAKTGSNLLKALMVSYMKYWWVWQSPRQLQSRKWVYRSRFSTDVSCMISLQR